MGATSNQSHATLEYFQKKAKEMGQAKTAFIVGAGAVKNSWAPVLRAAKEPSWNLTPEGVNSKLAYLVYLCRLYTANGPEADKVDICYLLEAMRYVICDEVHKAEDRNELTTRPEFHQIVDKFVIHPSEKICVINTNWDTVIDQALENQITQLGSRSPNCIHIHGRATDPAGIYLPSEIVNEPYREQLITDGLKEVHSAAINALEECDRVVIYGLSLSPLDVELGGIIWAGLNPKDQKPTVEHLQEVVLISLDKDLPILAERVNFLLQRPGVKVTGYSPTSLESGTDYTIPCPQ